MLSPVVRREDPDELSQELSSPGAGRPLTQPGVCVLGGGRVNSPPPQPFKFGARRDASQGSFRLAHSIFSLKCPSEEDWEHLGYLARVDENRSG